MGKRKTPATGKPATITATNNNTTPTLLSATQYSTIVRYIGLAGFLMPYFVTALTTILAIAVLLHRLSPVG